MLSTDCRRMWLANVRYAMYHRINGCEMNYEMEF